MFIATQRVKFNLSANVVFIRRFDHIIDILFTIYTLGNIRSHVVTKPFDLNYVISLSYYLSNKIPCSILLTTRNNNSLTKTEYTLLIMAYNLLKGKKGLIFGALNDKSIAWKAAERAYEEGARFVLTNTPVSMRMGTIDQLAEQCESIVIPADATKLEDLENLVIKGMEFVGGKFDFVLHSIGMSPNVRKGRTYDDLDYSYLMQTLDISAISFHKVLQVCRKLDAINDWGSVVALSYIAAQRTLYGYNDMADAKAMLESIARSFGYIYGREKHIRINTVSQSPTMTTAGSGIMGFDNLVDFGERMSPLGNATAEECADYLITLFSDLTRKVTMQNLYHDGGYSSMGMSLRAMKIYNEGLEYRDVKKDMRSKKEK